MAPLLFARFGRLSCVFLCQAAVAVLVAGTAFAQDAAVPTVSKTLEDFSGAIWRPVQWNKASGEGVIDESHAPDAAVGQSQKFTVRFSGAGFENFTVAPPQPLYIPGDAKKLTLRVKRSDKRYPVSLGIIDGWGRGQVNGAYLGAEFRLADTTDWQTVTFDVPPDWVRPIAVTGVTTHNFAATGEKNTITFQVDDITTETDISKVDPATGRLTTWKPDPNPADKATALKEAPATPLVAVSVATAEAGNVFSNTQPGVMIQVRNWKPGALTGKAAFSVSDDRGKKIRDWEESFSVESVAALRYPIEAKRFGIYDITAEISLSDGAKLKNSLSLAKVPDQKELTEEQKLISPYGINYHGGAERMFEAFKKAGIYWYRDYAFGLDMMRRAKGPDRKYAGWPFYPTIMQDYERLGLIVVPIVHGISEPVIKDGKAEKVGPDHQWVLDMADILVTFPNVKYWELDNEYDLPYKGHVQHERVIGWENYYLYHKKFGELVALLGGGKVTAVEQGRAGIYPSLEQQCIENGTFANIGAINSHHYCGTDPPEANAANFNRGLEPGQAPGFFFDGLRGVKRAALSDPKKKREAWLTEFGWDDASGPAVSREEQAAYLQRGFLLSFAAGTDKSFWFYNFDAEKKIQIFDSSGLFTFDKQPKLSLAAMAGLSALLPRPVYVGTIEAGPNTAGYVFENDGKLVAGLWTVRGNEGPEYTFKSGKLHDYFGNPLEGSKARLGRAPVYAVGLDKSDPLYRQTAYSLSSPYLILATAGDPASAMIEIHNNRDKELQGEIQMTPPKGWIADQPTVTVSVPPGERKEVPMNFIVGGSEEIGGHEVMFAFRERGAVVKTIPLRVMVQRPFSVEVSPIEGKPGPTKVNVAVKNYSARAQSGTVRLELPGGWQAVTQNLAIKDIEPGAIKTVTAELTWSPEWKAGESAKVVFQPADNKGGNIEAPLIPNQYRFVRAKDIQPDGKLEDWKAAGQMPEWLLGSTAGNAAAKLWFAWSPEGLYGAVEVQDSKGLDEDPKAFWGGDVLEMFVSTNEEARGPKYQKADHQFWLMPDLKNNRVYAGRWKVHDEIAETQYDIPGVQGASRRTKDGYVMEFFLPASAFTPYGLQPGAKIGLNANLTVRGHTFDREVFWPRKKLTGVNTQPNAWGTVILD